MNYEHAMILVFCDEDALPCKIGRCVRQVGFFKGSDTYNNGEVTVTQSQADILKNRIAALGYPAPKQKLEYITDGNLEVYKAGVSVAAGTAARSGSKLTMTGWKNVVAYEVCDNSGKPIFVSPEPSFTVSVTLPDGFRVNAIAADGAKVQVKFP